jgi:Omp85 superfamily domain
MTAFRHTQTAALLAFALAGLAPATTLRAQGVADAYLDEGARELVRLGRERRNSVDRSITHYETIVQERMSAGLTTFGRERLFYRRETAGRINWTRGGKVNVEVLGAREVIPPALKGAQVPSDLRGFMPHLAFDPVEQDIFVKLDTSFLRHPLANDAEEFYRYRSGDTTTIRLPDGRTIRLLELIVIPRGDDIHMLSGSFWLEEQSHAIVRAVFRPARAFDYDRDADEDDEGVPGFMKPIRAELLYITMEYGLWDLHWWLPRVIAAQGVIQVSFMSMPLRYERRYSAYEVVGDTTAVLAAADTTTIRPCRIPLVLEVSVGQSDDPERVARRRERQARRDSTRISRRSRDCAESFTVTVPEDSLKLLHSEYLPADPYGSGVELMTAAELEDLGHTLETLPPTPWQLRAPSFAWGLGAASLVRYNRVEALSIGAQSSLDLGRLVIDGTARIGLADLEPNGEISVTRETPGGLRKLTGYRRLAAANPDTRPFGFGNSLNALLIGRDDGEYFRAWGIEFEAAPPRSSAQWYKLRLYGEHQKVAFASTDFSLRHALNSDHVFGPTIHAARADQFGAALSLATWHGLDPVGFRWSAQLDLTGETGTFDFARPAATLRVGLPSIIGVQLSAEAGAGTSTGMLPIQSEWFVGGPASLRGYAGGILHGTSYWRGRAELTRGVPAVKLSLFSDAGWAGSRDHFSTADALASAGIGATFLDGLIRFDIARALRRPIGWRTDLFVSSSF